MGVETKIEWCHHTWSPWRGCAKISPGCQHCYAEALSRRNPKVLGEWGPHGHRAINADWRKPLAWDRRAAAAGERHRVFPSLCDPFEDRDDLIEPLGRFLELIARTPSLDHLVLTKRPGLWSDRLHAVVRRYHGGSDEHARGLPTGDRIASEWLDGDAPPNVWLGVSVEDRARKDRIDRLREIPAAVRFLSLEPLLEGLGPLDLAGIDWVIVGGESGPDARPCYLGWVKSIIHQCREAGVVCFAKQLGAVPLVDSFASDDGWAPHVRAADDPRYPGRLRLELRDRKGGDMGEWPKALRVREFPEVARAAGERT